MKEYLERSMRMERTMERLESIAEGKYKKFVYKPNEIERATYLLWVAHNLERIADRGVNIAERSMLLVGN